MTQLKPTPGDERSDNWERGVDACPNCGRETTNVQGVADCPACAWTPW